MATLDSSIVNVALPTITESFQTTISYSRWVVIAYLLSITGLLLLFGKLADVIGRKAIFILGYFVFTLGSILCGRSAFILELIFSRGIQGLGAAMLMANGPAIITSAFEARERGKALGILAMVVSLGLAAGPAIGGVLVKFFSWESVFFVNVPFGIMGAFLVYRYLPYTLPLSTQIQLHNLPLAAKVQFYWSQLRQFDWRGTLMWMGVQFGYSLAIDQDNILGFAGPFQRLMMFGSLGLLLLFLIWESSIEDPVLDLRLFKSKVFFIANLSAILNFISFSGITLLLPFYFQDICQKSPHEIGMMMSLIPLSIFIVAPISGRLSDRYGSRLFSFLGMSSIVLALLILGVYFPTLSQQKNDLVIAALILTGIGIGLFQSPNNSTILGAVPTQQLSVASALLATMRNLGLVSGAALSTSLFSYFHSHTADYTQSIQTVYQLLVPFALLGALTTLMIGTKKNAKKN